MGLSLKVQCYYKRRTERTTLESSLNGSYAGSCVKPGLVPWLVSWGRRELPLRLCRSPSPVPRRPGSLASRKEWVPAPVSPVQLGPSPSRTCFLRTIGKELLLTPPLSFFLPPHPHPPSFLIRQNHPTS